MTFDPNILNSKILVIENNPENTKLIVKILERGGYSQIKTMVDPGLALEVLNNFQPDLVLLDLRMPKVDGFQILTEIKEFQSSRLYLPVLVFTEDVLEETRQRALALGASEFLTKPIDPSEILLRVRNFLNTRTTCLELEHERSILETRVSERTADLLMARTETLECLASAAEYRDDLTGQHTQRVGVMSSAIAKNLGLDPELVELIKLAAPFHDLGKIGIPDAILLKPGKLNDAEYALMKDHTTIGAGILGKRKSPVIALAREIALSHHERWDGTGYCHGLAGEEIPIAARTVSVADAFDAMTHERPYQVAKSVEEAFRLISEASGSQFDPTVVASFMEMKSMIAADPALVS